MFKTITKKTTLRAAIAAGLASLMAMSMAMPAAASEAEQSPAINRPEAFTVKSTSNDLVRASVSAYKKENYQTSITYLNTALTMNLSKRRQAVVFSNLCAAYAQLGETEMAKNACAASLELRPDYKPAKANAAALTVMLAQN